MREEEKLEGGWEEVITNSWERRHGKGRNHLLPLLSFLLNTFPPTGGEGFLAERKGVEEEMSRL